MGQNAAEEFREAVRDREAAGDLRVDRLREVMQVLAYARNVIIASRMNGAYPACS